MRNWRFMAALVPVAALLVSTVHAGAMVPQRSSRLVGQDANLQGPVVERANGGYHWTISEDDIFGIEVGNVLAVNARKYADGRVAGVFHYKQSALGELFIFTVRVTCLNVYDGNRAKVGGVIEISNDPTLPPGVFLWFQAIDNGQGAADPPDRSTLIGAGDEAANEAFCDSPAPPNFGPWDVQGNLQVRD